MVKNTTHDPVRYAERYRALPLMPGPPAAVHTTEVSSTDRMIPCPVFPAPGPRPS